MHPPWGPVVGGVNSQVLSNGCLFPFQSRNGRQDDCSRQAHQVALDDALMLTEVHAAPSMIYDMNSVTAPYPSNEVYTVSQDYWSNVLAEKESYPYDVFRAYHSFPSTLSVDGEMGSVASLPLHEPVLRIAGESPYGFQGVPPKKQNKKSKSKSQTFNMRPEQNMKTGAVGKARRFEVGLLRSVSVRDSHRVRDPRDNDVIRGSIQQPIRDAQTDAWENQQLLKEDTSSPFHYGFSERQRPIPSLSYDMFRQIMQEAPPSGGPISSPQRAPQVIQPALISRDTDYGTQHTYVNSGEIQFKMHTRRTYNGEQTKQTSKVDTHTNSQPQQPKQQERIDNKFAKRNHVINGGSKPEKSYIPSDPLAAIAQILRQQAGLKTGSVSDIPLQKSDKPVVKRLRRTPIDSLERQTRLSTSFVNGQHNEQLNYEPRGIVPNTATVPVAEPLYVNLLHGRQFRQPEYLPTGGSAGEIGRYAYYGREVAVIEPQMAAPVSAGQCLGCKTFKTSPTALEGVTDFTTATEGKTLYKTPQKYCTLCREEGKGVSNGKKRSERKNVSAMQGISLPSFNPPYESDTDPPSPSATRRRPPPSAPKQNKRNAMTSQMRQPKGPKEQSNVVYQISDPGIDNTYVNYYTSTGYSGAPNKDKSAPNKNTRRRPKGSTGKNDKFGTDSKRVAPPRPHRDITKHFVPPPPSEAPPSAPQFLTHNPVHHIYNRVIPNPPKSPPPTPFNIHPPPEHPPMVNSSNRPLRVTVTAATPIGSVYSDRSSGNGQSSSSDLPNSSVSTSVTSHDDVTSSSTGGSHSRLQVAPVTLIL